MLPTKFQVSWPFGSGGDFSYFLSKRHPVASYQVSSQLTFWFRRRRGKIDFQDGRHAGYLRFRIRTILAIFYLQITPMLPTKFQIIWPFGSGEKAKKKKKKIFKMATYLPSWISDRSDLSYIQLTSPRCFQPIKTIVHLVQEKKRKTDFQDCRHSGQLGLQIGMIFNVFLIYKSPRCFLPSFKSVRLSVQEKKRKIDFQDGGHLGLGFPIETILTIFDRQVTPMLPTKFQVNWHFGSGEEN